MRSSSILAIVAILAIIGIMQPAHADEHEAASYQFETEVKIVTDQRTRGISDSLMEPSVKLGAQFAHESGLVAIADVVRVSKKQFMNGEGVGVTLGAGYRFGNPEG